MVVVGIIFGLKNITLRFGQNLFNNEGYIIVVVFIVLVVLLLLIQKPSFKATGRLKKNARILLPNKMAITPSLFEQSGSNFT